MILDLPLWSQLLPVCPTAILPAILKNCAYCAPFRTTLVMLQEIEI